MVYLQRYCCNLRRFVRYSHSQGTVNEDEISRFNKMSKLWWDVQGDMKPLHAMNSVRSMKMNPELALPPGRLNLGH